LSVEDDAGRECADPAAALPAPGNPSGPAVALAALCLIARLHQRAADPAALLHALGKSASEPLGNAELLLAAKHLGQPRLAPARKRLALTPLPQRARRLDRRAR
jgi:subfamily B ATP-binding cassette protein HlyB/CyaB